jgi:hypothetical protein
VIFTAGIIFPGSLVFSDLEKAFAKRAALDRLIVDA